MKDALFTWDDVSRCCWWFSYGGNNCWGNNELIHIYCLRTTSVKETGNYINIYLSPPIQLKFWVHSDCELVVWKECSDSQCIWRISGLFCCWLLLYLGVLRVFFWNPSKLLGWKQTQEWNERKSIDIVWRERGFVQPWSFPSRPLSRMSLLRMGLGRTLALFTAVGMLGYSFVEFYQSMSIVLHKAEENWVANNPPMLKLVCDNCKINSTN